MTADQRKQWVELRTGNAPKVLLNAIAAEGAGGTGGAISDANPYGRKAMTEGMANNLLSLIVNAGVGTAPGRLYLARLLRWHYGYDNFDATIPPNGVTPTDADFIRRRAYDLVDQARHYMPAPANDRQAA